MTERNQGVHIVLKDGGGDSDQSAEADGREVAGVDETADGAGADAEAVGGFREGEEPGVGAGGGAARRGGGSGGLVVSGHGAVSWVRGLGFWRLPGEHSPGRVGSRPWVAR